MSPAGGLKLISALFMLACSTLSVFSECPHEVGDLSRWSEASTWTSGQIPIAGEDVTVDRDILLDVASAELGQVTIASGSRLVFDPDSELAKLSAAAVLVEGEFWIGSEDCKFEGNAEVQLLGRRDETVQVDVNGAPHEKAVLVPSGGSLEVHGADKLVWTRLAETLPATTEETEEECHLILTLQDDVSGWSAGDTVVISSTDYDHEQAEEFELEECSECSANQIKIKNDVEFTHWGETTDGVPMAAEVGMLTRNVRFYGKMEEECYGNNKCDEFDFDTYGGHIKMFSGFESARIENAEIFHMGQNSRLGSYPIHFHMCGDISEMEKQPIVRGNSIHHTFARCLTIHGTSGLHVENNLAYDHYGHCFFLEDGGELNTVFERNLGLVTRETNIIPSDEEVSTYWITHPSTTLIGNVAGGSQMYGFWYTFPRQPIGPSANLGLLEEDQALRTPIDPFVDNVAHSNRVYGLRFDKIMDEDGEIVGGFDYNPRVDPTDPESERVAIQFDGFTAYKNYKCVRINGPSVTLNNFRVAETVEGVRLSRSSVGMKRLTNSLLVGETANKGEPERWIRLLNGTRVWWDRSVRMGGQDRSLPIIGLILFDSPVVLENVTFARYETNILRPSGAIGISRKHKGYTSPVNSVSDLSFEYLDPEEGNRFYDADFGRGFSDEYGTINTVLRDEDGSLTTYAGSTVVKPYDFLLNARCAEVPQWNMNVCPTKFTKVQFHGMNVPDSFITRNDQSTRFDTTNARSTMYALNSEEGYIVHFSENVPRRLSFTVTGVEAGISQVLAVCIGQNVQPQRLRVRDGTEASSADEVLSDTSGSTKYFLDKESGLVLFRFASSAERTEATESECPGDDGADSLCPGVFIKLSSSNNDGDCTSRAYPTYQTDPLGADGGLTTPAFG